MDRPTRSSHYQNYYHEVNVSETMLAAYTNGQSLSSYIDPWQYNDELYDLEIKLKERLYYLLETYCTDRQVSVFKLLAAGHNQQETANILGINQSGVHKTLNGNLDFTKNKKRYGGIIKKLRLLVAADKEIQKLLLQIRELKVERE